VSDLLIRVGGEKLELVSRTGVEVTFLNGSLVSTSGNFTAGSTPSGLEILERNHAGSLTRFTSLGGVSGQESELRSSLEFVDSIDGELSVGWNSGSESGGSLET